jgi:DNA-binding transcriptional ArsR family regulator
MADYHPDLAATARLIGDPVRARMLLALLGGSELPASELASGSGASAQSASGHLAKLVAGGLLQSRAAGRQRLFRLASAQIANALEALAAISPAAAVTSLSQHSAMQRLREARTCYDHFAGRLGVGIADCLERRGAIVLRGREFEITKAGRRLFSRIGIDVERARTQKRSFARACLDWTERRVHLAGSLGAALLQHALAQQWVRRHAADRSLRVTTEGESALRGLFGLQVK